MESSDAPATEYVSDMCVVCLDENLPVFCIRDCGHLCLCRGCAHKYQRSAGCPLCREKIRRIEFFEPTESMEVHPFTAGHRKREKLHTLTQMVTTELGWTAKLKDKTKSLRVSLDLCDWDVEAAFLNVLVQTLTNALSEPDEWKEDFHGQSLNSRMMQDMEKQKRFVDRVVGVSDKVRQQVEKVIVCGDQSAIAFAATQLHECVLTGLKLIQALPDYHRKTDIQEMVNMLLGSCKALKRMR